MIKLNNEKNNLMEGNKIIKISIFKFRSWSGAYDLRVKKEVNDKKFMMC